MQPSQVRARILADHDKLRVMITGLADRARSFDPTNPAAAPELRAAGFECFEAFAAHLKLEDEMLAPALEQVAENGEILADRLRREHHEQRELLEFLTGRLEDSDRPSPLVVEELRNFAEYVRLDMSHEEATILREDLLRDESDR